MMRNILAGFRFLTLSIGVSSWAFAADETFSPEQLRRIQEIVQAEREKIRADLLAELEANGLLNSGVPKKREEGNAQQIAAAEESRTVTAVDLRTLSGPFKRSTNGDLSPEIFLNGIGDTLFYDAVESNRSGFEITSSTESSKARIKIGRKLSSSIDDGGLAAVASSFALTASAPLDKNNDEFTNVATLDGLTNAFELSLKFSRFHMGGLRNPVVGPDGPPQRFRDLCALAGAKYDKGDCDTDTVGEGLNRIGRADLASEFDSFFFDRNKMGLSVFLCARHSVKSDW